MMWSPFVRAAQCRPWLRCDESKRVSKNGDVRVDIWRHEHTQSLRNGCDGAGRATPRTLSAGPQTRRAPDYVSPAGDWQCALLLATHGMRLAVIAARLPAVADRLLLFLAGAQGGDRGAEAGHAAGGAAAGRRPPAATECGEYG